MFLIPMLETQLWPLLNLPQIYSPLYLLFIMDLFFIIPKHFLVLYYICMYPKPSLPMNHSMLVNSLTIRYFRLNIIFVRPIQESILSLIDSFFTDVCITFGGHTTIYPPIPLLITFHFSDLLKLTMLL